MLFNFKIDYLLNTEKSILIFVRSFTFINFIRSFVNDKQRKKRKNDTIIKLIVVFICLFNCGVISWIQFLSHIYVS